MLIIKHEDAVKVVVSLIRDYCENDFDEDDIEFISTELEQKCYIVADCRDPLSIQDLCGLIEDVNPNEIASQIEEDNLRQWCDILRTEMNLALVRAGVIVRKEE